MSFKTFFVGLVCVFGVGISVFAEDPAPVIEPSAQQEAPADPRPADAAQTETPKAEVIPPSAETAAAKESADDELSPGALFNLIYQVMTLEKGYAPRTGYTVAASHLALCTFAKRSEGLRVAQDRVEKMTGILNQMIHKHYFPQPPPSGLLAGASRSVTIAAILTCKQGNLTNSEIINELINYAKTLGVGKSPLELRVPADSIAAMANYESAALMMPSYANN